jgi:hypothetical protein
MIVSSDGLSLHFSEVYMALQRFRKHVIEQGIVSCLYVVAITFIEFISAPQKFEMRQTRRISDLNASPL